MFFFIFMEALSIMIFAKVSGDFILFFSVGSWNGEETVISHLVFADDTYIF